MRNVIATVVLGISLLTSVGARADGVFVAQKTGAIEGVLVERIESDNPGLVRSENFKTGILNILGYILSFVGIIMMALIVWSGFRWMTSGGNKDVIEESRSILVRAVIGFAIIMLAFVIVQTFIRVTGDSSTQTSLFLINTRV